MFRFPSKIKSNLIHLPLNSSDRAWPELSATKIVLINKDNIIK